MIVKLDKADYQRLDKMLYLKEFPLIQSVVQQKQEGEIYADEKSGSGQLFVIHKSGFSYYLNSNFNNNDTSFFNFLNESEQLPPCFHIYSPAQWLVEKIPDQKKFNFKMRKRIQLKYSGNVIGGEEFSMPENYKIRNVDESNFHQMEELGFVENKFWMSKSDFLENGLGVCIFDNNKAVALCYSACVVNNTAEIDIITKAEFRKQGLGRIITKAFVDLSLKQGISPNWDCFEENVGSLKTALSTGFTVNKEYDFLSLYNK